MVSEWSYWSKSSDLTFLPVNKKLKLCEHVCQSVYRGRGGLTFNLLFEIVQISLRKIGVLDLRDYKHTNLSSMAFTSIPNFAKPIYHKPINVNFNVQIKIQSVAQFCGHGIVNHLSADKPTVLFS